MRLRHFLYIAVIVGAAYIAWAVWWPEGDEKDVSAWDAARIKAASVSVTSVLEKDAWLTFELPPLQTSVRILTNADVLRKAYDALEKPLPNDVKWSYVIDYQILDGDNIILQQGTMHYQTRVTEFEDPKRDTTFTSSSFLSHNIIPADTRTLIIPLKQDVGRAAAVRLRLDDRKAPLTGVVARVYSRPSPVPHDLRYVWQQMSPKAKELLAEGNLYGPNLLSEEEKRNILRSRWTPIAPRGIRDRDLAQRELYVVRGVKEKSLKTVKPPQGMLLDPLLRGTIPLPEDGGQVRLLFTLPPGNRPPQSGQPDKGTINVSWYGKRFFQHDSYKVPFSGKQAAFERRFDGGMIEVDVPCPLVLRAILIGTDGELTELETKPEFLPTYLCTPGKPVEYEVFDDRDAVRPFRVDLRRVLGPLGKFRPSENIADMEVSYECLDARGRVLKRGNLSSVQPLSLYDRLLSHGEETKVSDPDRYYFSLPRDTARIRFQSSDGPVVIAAYNRPPSLPTVTQVPEDYYKFERSEQYRRNWFLLRPPNYERLLLDNRVPTLRFQYRPREADTDLLAGQYIWEDYFPAVPWKGRYLFTPRDPQQPYRSEAAVTTFSKIPTGKPVEVVFSSLLEDENISPKLIYLKNNDGPVSLEVFIDGRPYHEDTVFGKRGVLSLPPIILSESNRRQTIEVTSSEPATVFLNYVFPTGDDVRMERLAMSFDRQQLEFQYEKETPDEELLGITLHRSPRATGRTEIEAKVSGGDSIPTDPGTSWTFRDRVFDLRPTEGKAVPVLGTEDQDVTPGLPFFMLLGEDLAPGQYTLRFRIKEGPGGYLTVSRTMPGLHDYQRFFVETPGGTLLASTPTSGSPAVEHLALPSTVANKRKQLAKMLREAQRGGKPATHSQEELQRVETLFQATMAGDAKTADLQTAWEKLGFKLTEHGENKDAYLTLQELPSQRLGRGFYAVRRNGGKPMVVEAPHGFFDLDTDEIALKLFQEGPFAAGAWNTVHRQDRDLAHTENTYFQAFTRACAKALPGVIVVQLHGFAHTRHSKGIARTATMIVSEGRSDPSPKVVAIARRMKAAFGPGVLLYPLDVQELGGAANVQSQALQQTGGATFVHIEMNEQMRLRLLSKASVRKTFLKCISPSVIAADAFAQVDTAAASNKACGRLEMGMVFQWKSLENFQACPHGAWFLPSFAQEGGCGRFSMVFPMSVRGVSMRNSTPVSCRSRGA